MIGLLTALWLVAAGPADVKALKDSFSSLERLHCDRLDEALAKRSVVELSIDDADFGITGKGKPLYRAALLKAMHRGELAFDEGSWYTFYLELTYRLGLPPDECLTVIRQKDPLQWLTYRTRFLPPVSDAQRQAMEKLPVGKKALAERIAWTTKEGALGLHARLKAIEKETRRLENELRRYEKSERDDHRNIAATMKWTLGYLEQERQELEALRELVK